MCLIAVADPGFPVGGANPLEAGGGGQPLMQALLGGIKCAKTKEFGPVWVEEGG